MGDRNPNSGAEDKKHPNEGGGARLRLRIADAITVGGGVSLMVEKTGIPLGTMSKYASKTSTASFTNAAKIATAANVQLDQIAFGSGSLSASRKLEAVLDRLGKQAENRLVGGSYSSPTDLDQPDMVLLPVYREVQASAGPGAMPVSELADGVISFSRYFLRDLGAAPDQCSVIWAKGDSMMPTIPDGSALVVDRSQVEISDGCIMVIGLGDSLLVKRIQRRTNGEIRLISDNKDYEPETLGPRDLHQLRVIGRVVYFGRTP